MFIREEWVNRTQFHPMKGPEVLREVIRRVEKVRDGGKLPIVVFDLDSTLFDVTRRSYEILREWLQHPENHSYQETVEALKDLSHTDFRYSLQDVWEARKVSHEDEPYASHFKLAKNYWRKRFFGNEYLIHDEPTKGAVEFVHQLYERGAKIVYLTGRDVPLMSFGTFDQLKSHRLPIEAERTRLILKPKRHHDDLDFKGGAAATIKSWGTVVASFENEPKNLVAMAQVYDKDTMNVFIHTVSSDHPAPVGQGIYRIDDFSLA